MVDSGGVATQEAQRDSAGRSSGGRQLHEVVEHFTVCPRSPDAPRWARRWFTERFRIAAAAEELEVALLVLSELVSNALRHGVGEISLLARVVGRRVRVEVSDHSADWAAVQIPDPSDGVNGRGLRIVEQLSDAWGCHPTPRGKTVWAERSMHPEAVVPA